MNVLLKPEIEKFVTAKVATGQYTDPSDLINEALEALREQEQFTPEHETYLRHELRRGLEQAAQGQFSDFNAETIIAQKRSKGSRRKAQTIIVARSPQPGARDKSHAT